MTIAIRLSGFALLLFTCPFSNVEMQRRRTAIRAHATSEAAVLDLVVFSFFPPKGLLVLPIAALLTPSTSLLDSVPFLSRSASHPALFANALSGNASKKTFFRLHLAIDAI
jgi:hypothetical protein